jgi:HSP20 family protein
MFTMAKRTETTLQHFDALDQLQTIRQQLESLSRRVGLNEWIPAVDILDEGDTYRLVLDIPGVNSEDLELREDGQTLTLAGVRHARSAALVRQERAMGQFSRTLELPGPIVAGSAQASLKSGVLEVVVQKQPQQSQKQLAQKQVSPKQVRPKKASKTSKKL